MKGGKNIINVLTAIGNEELNKRIKKEKEFKILENDIFYKEGIIEYLEKNRNVDIIIIYEKLFGEISLYELIKKIKIINNELKIFLIMEEKNEKIENIIKKENIFYNNKINIEKFIYELKNINKNKIEELNEEIKLLKEKLNKKEEEILELKNNKIKINSKNKLNYEKKNNKKEIIEDEKNIYIIFHKIKKYKINKKISKNIIKKFNLERSIW